MGHQRKCRMISSSVAQAALRKRTSEVRSLQGQRHTSVKAAGRGGARIICGHYKSPSSRAARSWGLIQLAGGPRQLDQTSPKGMRT